MSDYWVSHKRYLCKYCSTYIADDTPSRQQHENGMRHKGNVERFVRGLYKDGEKRVREREEEKGIMASVGKAAEAAYALDVASGRAVVGSSGQPGVQARDSGAATRPKVRAGKPSDPYANYSTAASLGYRDPDAEGARERMHAGTPGAWTVVVKAGEGGAEGGGGRAEKRGAAEAGDEEEEEEEDVRAFKLRRKTVRAGLLDEPSRAGDGDEPSGAEPSLFRKRKRPTQGGQ